MPKKGTRKMKSRLRSKSKKLFKMVQVPILNLMKKIEQKTTRKKHASPKKIRQNKKKKKKKGKKQKGG
tara:strand:- start:9 stop:212 length:204 start_codon:yes stop_codon:yes gene_type:complete